MISEFQGENRFLSNFWPCYIEHVIEGKLYKFPSTEHAYQASKFLDLNLHSYFADSSVSSGAAKKAARKNVKKIRPDWDEIKIDVMCKLTTDKYTRNPDLKYKLLCTYDKLLIEGNTWNDTFWGVCRGKGENNLGKILMYVRRVLAEESIANYYSQLVITHIKPQYPSITSLIRNYIMNFMHIKTPLIDQFKKMAAGNTLYRVNVSKDELWDTYINSFPQGSNNIYRTRTYHDCNCCKSFIRSMGNVVSINNGKIESIWDITSPDPNYQVVADSLSEIVKNAKISNVFYSSERSVGTDMTYQENDGAVNTWQHFHITIPAKFCMNGKDIGPRMADMLASHDVLLRSIEELSLESVDIILDLINENNLYRGEEHKNTLTAFRKILVEAKKVRRLNTENAMDTYVWSLIGNTPGSVSRIRNTAIGQLLTAISSGMSVDEAVRIFESMVAPANYKRPTAIVTKVMIENAKNKIEELGLTSSLNRRYARMDDISINNVIFADRSIRPNMSQNVFDELSSKAVAKRGAKKKKTADTNEVTIEDFLNNIIPNITSLEVIMENKHVSNLVSLIAPVDDNAKNMFKWNNAFSWSYNGDVTDSIKERVKKAGGSITGDLCCRLAWHNYDDLDFHMSEPMKGHIYYANKISRSGGCLDVDMNAGGGHSREPVENIFYSTSRHMPEGDYKLSVNQFNRRDNSDYGFEVEIDINGEMHSFTYDREMATGNSIQVATINYSKTNGFTVTGRVSPSNSNKTQWNVTTNNYHKVNMVMLSPNHWDDNGIGNKHYFFMLDQCRNDDVARGFYNEFLMEELTPHRKVIEIVASKMKTEEDENQLSGLGFSSTIPNSIMVRVDGTRTMKVVF